MVCFFHPWLLTCTDVPTHVQRWLMFVSTIDTAVKAVHWFVLIFLPRWLLILQSSCLNVLRPNQISFTVLHIVIDLFYQLWKQKHDLHISRSSVLPLNVSQRAPQNTNHPRFLQHQFAFASVWQKVSFKHVVPIIVLYPRFPATWLSLKLNGRRGDVQQPQQRFFLFCFDCHVEVQHFLVWMKYHFIARL